MTKKSPKPQLEQSEPAPAKEPPKAVTIKKPLTHADVKAWSKFRRDSVEIERQWLRIIR